VEIPAGLRASPVLQDEAGRTWLAELPDLILAVTHGWALEVDGPTRHGAHALVLPVRWAGQPAVLRLARPEPPTLDALRRWDGHGSVRLLHANPQGTAVLLERLDAERSLTEVPALRAAAVAGEIARKLALPAGPDVAVVSVDPDVPGVPARWVDLARGCAEDLADDPARLLVHIDLTRENVVRRRQGEYVAIDPRVAAGRPERAAAELLLRSVDDRPDGGSARLLREFVTAGEMDHALAWRWCVARTVEYWGWALTAGLTEDPERCRILLTDLADGTRPGP